MARVRFEDEGQAVIARVNAAQQRSGAALSDLQAALNDGSSHLEIEEKRVAAVASYEAFLDAVIAHKHYLDGRASR